VSADAARKDPRTWSPEDIANIISRLSEGTLTLADLDLNKKLQDEIILLNRQIDMYRYEEKRMRISDYSYSGQAGSNAQKNDKSASWSGPDTAGDVRKKWY
jgi:hypothetical protein